MDGILSFKNLTKKIAIFLLVFFIFVFSDIKIADAKISAFGYGANADLATCKKADDTVVEDCKISSILTKSKLDNPNYKLENTNLNLERNFISRTFKLADFNISLDNFIKERLYKGDEGYFANKFERGFDYIPTEFSNFAKDLSPEETKSISLLWGTLGSNLETQETKLRNAKFITKSLAGNDQGVYSYEDLQIANLIYHYLKIYLTINKYLDINKNLLSQNVQTKLTTINNKLRKTIYHELYKKDSIKRADGCTTDGTELEKCTIFSQGSFTVRGFANTQDQKILVMPNVNLLKLDASKDSINVNNTQTDPNITNADPNTRNASGDRKECTQTKFWAWWGNDSIVGDPACSVAAYFINKIISGVASLVGVVVDLAGALFDWIYDKGVINFKDWVTGSGAYLIYKRIILSLIVSVMTFFVFYLIIRRLIDDDGDKMNKILPGLIITFLFVYFSFTITGWIIDQSNIITIKIYRSMTQQEENNEQGIATVLQRTLDLEKKSTKGNSDGNNVVSNFGVSYGSWDAVPFTLGQLVVNIVSVFVLFQGAILILSRTIILLLCMIFSPLMILPEGLTEFTDKYKKLVMDNFTGNILLGPVFMFLVLLAVEIGQATTSWMGATGNAPGYKPSLAEAPPNFLGGIISSVLVIVVLQLAISASKSLSGSMGEKLSGVIGKYTGKAGGLAFSGGKTLGGGALRGVMNNTKAGDKINDWITKGSTKSGLRGRLFSGAKNITEKYKLDGKEKKEEKESDHIVETYNKANTRQKDIIKKDLEKRALKGEKGAESALKKINKNIEDEKNTEFEREEKTKKRESYEQKEKGGEKPPDANEASHVEAGTKPTTPPTQNANAQGIPKENKEKGIQLHNSPHKEADEDNAHENDDRELVQHENNFTHSSKGDSSNNHNNDSQNKAIHTDNLQVVANNIQLLTGDKLVNRARKTNEEGAGPKAYISNGEESSMTQNKPVIISNNSREEKNVSGNQMKANINTAKKIISKNNKDEEYIEYEDIPAGK
jgi:hypothetical protein